MLGALDGGAVGGVEEFDVAGAGDLLGHGAAGLGRCDGVEGGVEDQRRQAGEAGQVGVAVVGAQGGGLLHGDRGPPAVAVDADALDQDHRWTCPADFVE